MLKQARSISLSLALAVTLLIASGQSDSRFAQGSSCGEIGSGLCLIQTSKA